MRLPYVERYFQLRKWNDFFLYLELKHSRFSVVFENAIVGEWEMKDDNLKMWSDEIYDVSLAEKTSNIRT